ncbi:hypothetical protein B0A54_16219 [Friedmanniomyces endolithicus]|uniref:Uncharacterized protein n=1 Tax=Friedmanniomyces endolithicus TaxID=329885 RepID=A0A4V5N6K3_9PEZI|nr:hypothetical protein LTS09_017525 [Friedmanniomyces endolithicus]TKA29109.1 hypothetical protein B0A54_16219 [Friedmanniomyces endolithicus]
MAVTATPSNLRKQPASQQKVDNIIQPFLHKDFDPADYLNSALPALSTTVTPAQSVQHGRTVPLPELNAQLQTVLSQVNAQMTRWSNTLTQLTDEIIRCGGRLAYEVEVLRGDTTGLTDVLDNRLRKEIELLAPRHDALNGEHLENEVVTSSPHEELPKPTSAADEPEYLNQLRTLTAVRSRLDAVIQVFGDAMAWPLAPSELTSAAGASSLISISGPASDADTRDREAKGRQYLETLRSEINDQIGTGDDLTSLSAAATRLGDLRELAEVWKGTVEEKARVRLVESLLRPVEERLRLVERTGQQARGAPVSLPSAPRGTDLRYGDLSASSQRAAGEGGGYGFLQNLRNLRDEMYLD